MKPSLAALLTVPAFLLSTGSAFALNILMVTNNNGTTQSLNDFLVAEGHTVTRGRFDLAAPTPAQLVGIDLVLVARESNSGDYNTAPEPVDWNGIARPMICMAPHIMRNSIWGWVNGAGLSATTAVTSYNPYPDTGHPFLAGVSGTQYLTSAPPDTIWNTNTVPAAATVVATIGTASNPAIFLIPSGTTMFNSKGTAGALRIGFIRGEPNAWTSSTADAKQILRNMIRFAVPPIVDADGDGLPDIWEIQYSLNPNDNGLNPNNVGAVGNPDNGANGDPDGEGLVNSAEYTRGTDPRNPDTDADGYNDRVETNSGTFDSVTTDTGTHSLTADTDNDGLKDGVETNTGMFMSANNTGTHPLRVDTDNDGMRDGFEVTHLLNPHVDDSLLDPDNDMSNNLAEFTRGTLPRNPDTDADGYKDGIETNDGSFDSVTSDTGTNPLNPDTDGDGLKDGAETNSGVFVDATNAGSHPLTYDTDNDKFPDGSEALRGFSPVNAGSHPPARNVLFLGANATPNFAADGAVFTFLEYRYGIGNITYMQASAVAAGVETGFDVAVLSSTPASGDLRSKFHNSTVGVVNWEEAITDFAAGEFGLSSVVMTKSTNTTQLTITEDHPITSGLTGTIDFVTAGETVSTGGLFPGLLSVAIVANGTGVGNPAIFIAKPGDLLADTTGASPAMGRRVMFPITDATFNTLTPAGHQLFAQSIDWASGLTGNVVLRITDISRNIPAGELSITWTSDPAAGTFYSLFADPDVTRARGTWPDLSDSIPTGGTTTTFTFPADVVTKPLMFYYVRKNP